MWGMLLKWFLERIPIYHIQYHITSIIQIKHIPHGLTLGNQGAAFLTLLKYPPNTGHLNGTLYPYPLSESFPTTFHRLDFTPFRAIISTN